MGILIRNGYFSPVGWGTLKTKVVIYSIDNDLLFGINELLRNCIVNWNGDINDTSALAYLSGTMLHVSQLYFRSGSWCSKIKKILSILDQSVLNTHVVRLFIQPRRCILDLRRDFWFKETNYLATNLLTIPVTFQFSRTIRSQLNMFVLQTLLLMTKANHQAFVVLYN